MGWLREFVVEGGHGGEGLQLVVGVSFAIGQFGVGLDPQWWGLVVVRWQGRVASIGTGRPGVVAYASVG